MGCGSIGRGFDPRRPPHYTIEVSLGDFFCILKRHVPLSMYIDGKIYIISNQTKSMQEDYIKNIAIAVVKKGDDIDYDIRVNFELYDIEDLQKDGWKIIGYAFIDLADIKNQFFIDSFEYLFNNFHEDIVYNYTLELFMAGFDHIYDRMAQVQGFMALKGQYQVDIQSIPLPDTCYDAHNAITALPHIMTFPQEIIQLGIAAAARMGEDQSYQN